MSPLAKLIIQDAERVVSRVDLSPLTRKRVTVIGATGIIGTHVMACLHVFGKCQSVVPVSSHRPEPGHPSLEFNDHPWRWTKINLTHPEDQSVIPPADYTIYAAGYGQPAKFTAKPLDTLKINTIGLLYALRSQVPDSRLLYVSSSEVYSGNPNPPYKETDHGETTPQHPRACYIEAKRCGEAICASFNKENQMRATAIAARVALGYGPGTRKDDNRVLYEFIRQAILSGEIRLRDLGKAQRTYCYIADCVEQLFRVWLYGQHEVYNVGGYDRVTIADLAGLVGRYCNVPVHFPNFSALDDTAAPKIVDMSLERIEKEFNRNENFVQIDDGVARTVDYHKVLLNYEPK